MSYVVVTSDGKVHEFSDSAEAVACLDEYGPEVVDHNICDCKYCIGGPERLALWHDEALAAS